MEESQIELISASDTSSTDPEAVRRELRSQETLTGNVLATDIIYIQHFTLLDADYGAEFKERILVYADKMLNNKKFGIVFFKAQIFSNVNVKREASISVGDVPGKEFVVHFHAFAENFLTEDKLQMIDTDFLPLLLTGCSNKQIAKVVSTDIVTLTSSSHRKPVYIPHTEESDAPDQIGGLEKNDCCHKCINFWLIVPRVQWDFFDLLYQLYTFDIAHQGFIPKFVHFFTIPIDIILFFMFLAQFKFPGSYIEDTTVQRGPFIFPANWSYLPLGILILAYAVMGLVRKCATWGFATAVVIAMLWGVGNLFYESVRLPKDINATGIYRVHWLNPVYLPYNPIIWSYIVSVIQASSHMLVPQMSPYITGVTHWESLHHFLWHYNGPRQCCYKILALLCFPILSVSVAYFSWPHLIGTQVFYIMAGIGYNHSYFQKYKLVTEKAELSGNPRLAYFPGRADTLMNPEHPYMNHLKAHGILDDDDAKDGRKVAKAVTSYHIYNRYFRGHHMATDSNERDSHIYHYKAFRDINHFQRRK